MDTTFYYCINNLDSQFKEYCHRNFNRVGISEKLLPYLIGLDENAGITPNELLNIIGEESGRISRAVEKMVQLGMVEKSRSDRDKRTYALQLTDIGKATCAKIRAIMREWEDAALTALSDEEHRQLTELLAKIADSTGRDTEKNYKADSARKNFSLLDY